MNGIAKHDLLDKVVTLHKNIQIYKAAKSGTVGPKSDQYRDCIDISVKLAFIFNHSENINSHSALNLPNITNVEFVKVISNNDSLDANIVDSKLTTRIKQSSDMKIVEIFYKTQAVLNQNFKLLDLINPNQSDKMQESFTQIFKSDKQPFQILQELSKLNTGVMES